MPSMPLPVHDLNKSTTLMAFTKQCLLLAAALAHCFARAGPQQSLCGQTAIGSSKQTGTAIGSLCLVRAHPCNLLKLYQACALPRLYAVLIPTFMSGLSPIRMSRFYTLPFFTAVVDDDRRIGGNWEDPTTHPFTQFKHHHVRHDAV
jgi:hypothetical protein